LFKELLGQLWGRMNHKTGTSPALSNRDENQVSDCVGLAISATHVNRESEPRATSVNPDPKLLDSLNMTTAVILVVLVLKRPFLIHYFAPFFRLHAGQSACMS